MWGKHVGEGQLTVSAMVGFTLRIDLPQLALFYGNKIILGWSHHQKWGGCVDERPWNDLCHICAGGRKRDIHRLKGEDAL